MINLLPSEAEKKVKRDYWLRVVSVWMLLLTLLCLIFVTELVPSRVLIGTLRQSISTEVEGAAIVKSDYQNSEKIVKDTNILVKKLANNNRRDFSALIAALDEFAGDDIKIDHINFDADSKIKIGGVAATRIALSNFHDTLLASGDFADVNLPIADLAKDKNASFNMTLTFNNKTN